jgi:DNA-binding transcriptional regulator YdaS (Cro superfamily)
MDTSAIERACDIAGGQAALARKIGVHVSFPNQWVKGRRPVPAERCPSIEKATARQVTCEQLRPDVDWAYLRGTASGDSCATEEAAASDPGQYPLPFGGSPDQQDADWPDRRGAA